MFLSSLISGIARRRRQRLVALELNALSDQQLDDIGLSRIGILEAVRRR